MNQVEKAARFSELHVKGAPLLLYNAWDAGTAKSILDAGAKAIATSSWAVAEAQGYRDGESIPITFVEQIIARIVSTIDAPVSVDFEGGYSDDNGALAENVARLLELGIIGINFEDRVVQGAGLYPIDQHARRIAAIREAARAEGVDLFINARTDLFLGQQRDPANSINDALDRAKAYAAAGASGFFIPGLRDDALIGHICDGVALPVQRYAGVAGYCSEGLFTERTADLRPAMGGGGPCPIAAVVPVRDHLVSEIGKPPVGAAP
jgi:2-methylisocitrate lyase-like PEP mutase family enzyme